MTSSPPALLPVDRFLQTLDIVAREGRQLLWSRERVFAQPIDRCWVAQLPDAPEIAETLEAFVSRFGRMQDTIADKLLPRWLQALAERPGSQIETLNRAERLGVLQDVTEWLEARALRNRLVHEYMTDSAAFAADLGLAYGYCLLLVDTYNRVRSDAAARLGITEAVLPPALGDNATGQ
jgi:hypothetical protein